MHICLQEASLVVQASVTVPGAGALMAGGSNGHLRCDDQSFVVMY